MNKYDEIVNDINERLIKSVAETEHKISLVTHENFEFNALVDLYNNRTSWEIKNNDMTVEYFDFTQARNAFTSQVLEMYDKEECNNDEH